MKIIGVKCKCCYLVIFTFSRCEFCFKLGSIYFISSGLNEIDGSDLIK